VRSLACACLLCFVVTACGSEHVKKRTKISGGSDCAPLEITTPAAREGVCVANGTTVTAVDRAHLLHMNEYEAELAGVRTAASLGELSADKLQRGGQFVVVTLRVKNTGKVARAFDRTSNLVFLLVDRKQYPETLGAGAASPGSFSSHGAEIEPGQFHTGTIVFDLPLEHARNVRARGSDLVFLNFGDEGRGFPMVGTTPAIGFLRLWK
jgi:hypothetical protein